MKEFKKTVIGSPRIAADGEVCLAAFDIRVTKPCTLKTIPVDLDVTSSGVSVTMHGDGIETLAVSTSLAEQLLNIVACPKCKTIQRFDSNGITCAKCGLDFSDERYSRYRRVLKALNLPHISDPATKFFSGNEINCPFCNSPGVVIGAMKTNGGYGALYWYECMKCGGRTPRKATPGEAREKAKQIALAIVRLELE